MRSARLPLTFLFLLLTATAAPLAAQRPAVAVEPVLAEDRDAGEETPTPFRFLPPLFPTPTPSTSSPLFAIPAPFTPFPSMPPRFPGFLDPRPFSTWAAEWTATGRAAGPRPRPAEGAAAAGPVVADPPSTPGAGVAGPPDGSDGRPTGLPFQLPQDFADLGMRVSGRGEFGGAWTRFRPCDPGLQFNCSSNLLPLLKPDVQFGVEVAGTISQRIHVDVDYDQRREFDASNNINIYYQGLAGEVLQRLELGDVSIRLPTSRYLTDGIPGGNFGFRAAGQVRGLDVQAVWAQQKGDVSTREFRLGGGGGGAGASGLVQDASLALDDADYVRGQFFFLVDPARLNGYPHLRVLSLRSTDAPADLRPARGATIQLYRDERPSFTNPQQQAQLGYFLADAVSGDGRQSHAGQYRRMVPGEDYWVHASGLWLVLRSPLRPDEALAAAYATDDGGAVGTLEAERIRVGDPPRLLLVRGPATIHQPGQSTWNYEMHQVYRVDGGTGVEPGSIELRISRGEIAAGATYVNAGGRPLSYLKLFGLDEDPPYEKLDEAQLFEPGRGGLADGLAEGRFTGTYVIFPTLEPFLAPPPVPSAGLDAAAAAALLGREANPAIYRSPDPVLREGSGVFRLNFRFRVRLDGLISSFNLGAFGIREGSERITVDGRPLLRGSDYVIDYGIGQVTLLDPQAVYGTNPDAEVRATWEQKAVFQLAPKSLFGLSTHYPFGQAGELNLVGLYQAERAVAARPQLGLEPGGAFLGGASGRFDLDAPWLARAVSRLPGSADAGGSRLRLGGELALSLPDPNRRGDTYLDDFESTDEITLGLERTLWRLGSRPDEPTGIGMLPAPFEALNAGRLVWQHDLVDGAGRVIGGRLARDIDRQINVAGAQRTESVMYLTLADPSVPTGTWRWRSMTTVLGTTGRDMSRSEFLEFYASAAPNQEMVLVLDIGSVSEDAFALDLERRTSGTYVDGRPWGLGVLDEEARTADREIWSTALDSLGLWNEPCRADPFQAAYPLGDRRANCTRGNGLVDTEDLDGNGILDARDGPLFRYVVRLDGSSPYLVRDRNATGTEFALYRIPLRGPGGVAAGGASEGTWRYIKHLRMTVTGRTGGPGSPDLLLARMRVAGSRWAKREVHGIMRGLTGDEPGSGAVTGSLQVGPVSRITDGSAYASPPGIGDQLQDPNSVFGGTSIEYNEKALRLSYSTLEPGDRAEAYFRYPQQPRNFLQYRQMRLWVVPRAGRWDGRAESLVVSVGTDVRNRYLLRTSLRTPPPGGRVQPADWLELVADFERWFELKAAAERMLLLGDRPPGEPLVLWSGDGVYGIVLEDRARAPNLAAVRELGFAVHNADGLPVTGEVWVNDVRLAGAVSDPGVAGHMDAELRAGDFASLNFSMADQGAVFQRFDQMARQQGTRETGLGGTAQLGRLVPAGWRIDAPISISHTRSSLEPVFLEASDVRADRIEGLRDTGADRTRVGLTLRRAAAMPLDGYDPVAGPASVLDGASIRLGWQSASLRAITSQDRASGFDGGIGYDRRLVPREVALMPGFARDLLRRIAPPLIEESAGFERLVTARLRWNPEAVRLGSGYQRQETRSWRWTGILATDADTLIQAIRSPREDLDTQARILFRPLESISAGVTVTSNRDLLRTDETGVLQGGRDAIEASRGRLAGIDLGWETRRTVSTFVDFRPAVASWLRPVLSHTTRYRGDRSASWWEEASLGQDTVARLQRTFEGERQTTRGLLVDPAALSRAVTGGGPVGPLVQLGRAIELIDLSWSDAAGSRFERELADPAWAFQLGFTGEDGLRTVDGVTAASASEREGFRARSMIRLPARASFEVAYGETTTRVEDVRGGPRSLEERSWPDLRLGWNSIPIPGPLRGWVVHGAAGVGLRRTSRTAIFGDLIEQRRAGMETAVPLQASVGLASGLSASYSGQLALGTGRDPTGGTESDGAQHAVQVSGSFFAPQSWRENLPDPIRTSLRFARQNQAQCRLIEGTGTEGVCIPYVDLVNRQFNLRLDTVLSQLTVGFQMSYTDRQSFVGTRSGSSQFQLGLFGEFNFAAGTFAPEGGR